MKLGALALSGTLSPAAASFWCFSWRGLSVICSARHIVLNGDEGAEGELLPKLPSRLMFHIAHFIAHECKYCYWPHVWLVLLLMLAEVFKGRLL